MQVVVVGGEEREDIIVEFGVLPELRFLTQKMEGFLMRLSSRSDGSSKAVVVIGGGQGHRNSRRGMVGSIGKGMRYWI